jgi:hypothetical protein
MENNPYKDTHYRGLLYTAVTDTGPKVLCNLTQFDEDHTFPLSVQAFTLLGLGSGSKTAGTWMEYTYGPLPFPTGRPLNTMVYSFLIEGSDSKDDRVIKAGRAAALIFIVTKQFNHYDKLRKFMNNALPKFIKNQKSIKDKHLKKLNNEVLGKSIFQIGFEESEEKSVDLSTPLNQSQEKTTKSSSSRKISAKKNKKSLFMEKLIELDNLAKSLLILHQTSKNPTISELTKISGTSRIMTTFSLRKYVKNGIIELDGDDITFL